MCLFQRERERGGGGLNSTVFQASHYILSIRWWIQIPFTCKCARVHNLGFGDFFCRFGVYLRFRTVMVILAYTALKILIFIEKDVQRKLVARAFSHTQIMNTGESKDKKNDFSRTII